MACAGARGITRGRLTLPLLLRSFEGTVRTTAMVMAILIAAYFLNFVITSIGLTNQVNRYITVASACRRSQLLVVGRPLLPRSSACSWRRCR
jgi:TRAP-type C4-dicarboxylate transport system permease large subunit